MPYEPRASQNSRNQQRLVLSCMIGIQIWATGDFFVLIAQLWALHFVQE